MADEFETIHMKAMVARFQAGDSKAFDELIRRTGERLARQVARMLRGYPVVGKHERPEDVLQEALRRLTGALREVTPGSVREFYGLASEQMRRTLLDLARYHRNRAGVGRHRSADDSSAGPSEPAAPDDGTDLDLWADLQEVVFTLPVAEREVFCLTFYHGWTQDQIAELLGLGDRYGGRQVRRLLRRAADLLRERLGRDLPAGDD